jgi:hypothetical protein
MFLATADGYAMEAPLDSSQGELGDSWPTAQPALTAAAQHTAAVVGSVSDDRSCRCLMPSVRLRAS